MRRGMRQRCRNIVRDLEIPSPFDVQEFCRRLGDKRGRPIRLLPMDLPPDCPCGLWLSTEQADFVFFQQETSGPHQLQIILHELGHLLCEHRIGSVLSDDLSQLLVPDLDPALIKTMLGRGHYSQEAEQEAETIATLILGEVSRFSPERTFEVPAEVADVVRRISRSYP
ncbi:hypothetical protein EDD30_6390 [Couchioplanes caeruleus]|uniref:IrrE N-terminal-like domain-containing protein n=2 Tax=Couchioplanes caeruleus TaxID=56438 RepID=A0A3N1GT25_9ACTN|nr:hypothetical protein EDD30_6390 [Couchioplanes caeruleus]